MGVNGIYGLSGSGLDIESLVKVGMMSKQNEYDKMAQKYTKNEWTKNALLDLSNQINTFNLSSLSDYKLSTTMNAKTAKSSDESAVTAAANATSPLMTHKVTVKTLSSNAYLTSYATIADIIASTKGISKTSDQAQSLANDAKLSDILFNNLKEGSTKVTSEYSSTHDAGTTANGFSGYDVYSQGASRTLITKTGVKITNDGKSISVKYQGTNATSPSTIIDGSLGSQTSQNTKTTTVTNTNYAGTNGTLITLKTTNVTEATDDVETSNANTYTIDGYTKGTTTTDENGVKTTTFTKGNSRIQLTEDTSGNITLTAVNEDGIALDSSNRPVYNSEDPSSPQTISEPRTPATFTERTSTTSTTTVVTTNYYGGGKKVETTNTDANSNTTKNTTIDYASGAKYVIDVDANNNKTQVLSIGGNKVTIAANGNVTTETYENGITGTTLKDINGANAQSVSSGFTVGQYKSITRADTALEFTIADSKETGATAAKITITYDDILGNDADGKKPMTMNDLVSKIKDETSKVGLNINATYDNLNGRFAIYNTKGDVDSSIVITATHNSQNVNAENARNYAGRITTNFFNALQLRNFNGTDLDSAVTMDGTGGGKISVSGSNGTINVDGIDYATKDNKVIVGGITYTATNRTLDASGNVTAATVTVGQDVDGIVDKVKSFVEGYNKLLGSLYEMYDEKPESGYTPLTQSQKDSMKEEQIEKWEEKAKKGLLYHDQTLSRIINRMRTTISSEIEGVDSKFNSAYSIGISTTGIKGQLTLNEEKLRNALAEDSDAAYNVFAKLNVDATADNTGVVKENGIAQRLGDIFNSSIKLIRSRAGSSADITEDSDLNNLLRELQTKMSNFKKLMSAFEDKLYKKYDAMEVALSKLGSQLNFITGGQ